MWKNCAWKNCGRPLPYFYNEWPLGPMDRGSRLSYSNE
jgi:hypothetical protein